MVPQDRTKGVNNTVEASRQTCMWEYGIHTDDLGLWGLGVVNL